MLASPEFAQSERMSRFLRFVVSQALAGKSDSLKESVIGVSVFDRDPGYDPKADPVVRSEARRLRSKLLEYAQAHSSDPLWIDLPKGGYVPEFRWRGSASSAGSAGTEPITLPLRAVPPTPWIKRHAVTLSIGTAAVLAALLGAWLLLRRAPVYSVLDARPFTTYNGSQSSPAFSPDGETVAFTWGGPTDGAPSIWTQPVSGGTARQITHTPTSDSRPIWSPNGRQLAFLRTIDKTHAAIYTVDAPEGHEQKRAEVIPAISAVGRVDWSPDGRYLVTSDRDSPETASAITLISFATGEKRRVTAPNPRIPGDTDAAFSADGRMIAFRRSVATSVEDLYIAPVPAPSSRQPVPESQIKRLTFDDRAIGGHAWAPDARSIVAASQRAGSTYALWRVPLSGSKPTRLTQAGIVVVRPAISKRGDRLAFESVINDSNIWTLETQGGGAARFLMGSTMVETSPQVSPDGSRIAFRSNRSGADEIWVADAGGARPVQITHFNGPLTGSPRWSPDSRELAFDSRQSGNPDIYVVPADGGTPRRFTTESSSDVVPSWSRDGKYIYFGSDRSGTWQVWKQPVAAGPAQQVTRNGGFAAFESADGQYVYYSKVSSDGGLWRVPVAGGSEVPVLPNLPARLWGNWALGRHGIYFLQYRKAPPAVAAILFSDFDTKSTREIGATTGLPMAWDSGFALSPDEKVLVFAQVDHAGSNLYISDDFR
jgi:Tol biopolymer transport system component